MTLVRKQEKEKDLVKGGDASTENDQYAASYEMQNFDINGKS